MPSTVLSEYLERYAGDEYVFTSGLDVNKGVDLLIVFRLMEKTSLSYNYVINCSYGFSRCVIKYTDGTTKPLTYGSRIDHVIKDKEELKKLDNLVCANMEVVDIIGSANGKICFRKPFCGLITINVGGIVDREMLVYTSNGIHKMMTEIMDKRLSFYLNNKG